MDDFIFDLQRFDTKQETLVIGYQDDAKVITLGSGDDTIAKSIKAGSSNNVTVTLNIDVDGTESVTTAAAISLENNSDFFFVSDSTGTKKYSLNTSKDGIVVSIGSDSLSMATVGSLDNDEIFYVEDTVNNNSVKFWKTNNGIFSSSNEALLASPVSSSVVLSNTSLDSSNGDLTKIIDVNDAAITITGTDAFGNSRYSSVLAMDTSTSDVYAELFQKDDYNNYYRIIKGSSNESLKSISIASGIASSDVYMNFNDPTINAGGTEFHVDNLNGTFHLYGAPSVSSNEEQVISLSSDVTKMSLYDGNLIFADAQSLDATNSSDTYTFHGYDDTNDANHDGIIVYTDSNAISTLGDIDVGESFVLTNGTTSDTYTRSNIGLIKKGADSGTDSILTYDGNRLTGSNLSFAAITGASAASYYEASVTPIVINGSNTGSSIFAYGTNALATVSASGTTYSLSSGSNHTALHLDNWAGVSLTSGTLIIPNNFIGSSPLNVALGTATFGVTSIETIRSKATAATLSSTSKTITINPDVAGTYNDTSGPIFGRIKSVNLVKGSLQAKYGTVVRLSSAQVDLSIVSASDGFYPLITYDGSKGVLSKGNTSDFSASIGRGYVNSHKNPVTVDSDGNTTISGGNVTIDVDDVDYKYSQSVGSVNFIYGRSEGVSVNALDAKDIFYLNKGSSTIYYEYTSDGKLVSYTNRDDYSGYKIWSKDGQTSTENEIYGIDDEYFHTYMPAINNKITINSDYSALTTGESINIIESTSSDGNNIDLSNIYGYFVRTSDGYSISGADANRSLTSIFINDDVFGVQSDEAVTVQTISLDSSFSQISKTNISISAGSIGGHNFKLGASDSVYAISSVTSGSISAIHVTGANSISLGGGTLLSYDPEQTINASGYSIIYSNTDSEYKTNVDGITVGVSISGSNTVRTVGDIEVGESFYIGNTEYTRKPSPLFFTTNDDKSYILETVVSGDITKNTGAVEVDISDFKEANKRDLIQASLDTYEGTSAYVLVIGKEDSVNYMVVDDVSDPKSLYADLKAYGDNTYWLTTSSLATGSWGDSLNVVSVVGGSTTINSSLVKNATIVNNSNTAAFKVNDSSVDFVFSGDDDIPTIQNANSLTLFNGNIYTASLSNSSYQTVRLGDNDVVALQAINGTKISYGDEEATIEGTVNGSTGTDLSVRSGSSTKRFSVKSGSMDFVVDDSLGAVTITGLNSTESDAFYYHNGSSGSHYSLVSAGLIKSTVTTGNKINVGTHLWNGDGVHTLTGNSIEAASLTSSSDWLNISIVDGNTITVAPNVSSLIFIDSTYTNTYGTLEGNNKAYTLTKGNDDLADDFTTLYLSNSSRVTLLELDDDFLGKTITSTVSSASFVPTALVSGANSYQVTIDTSAKVVGLSSVASASLTSGALKADSALSVSVSVSNGSTAYINPIGDSQVTLYAANTKQNGRIALKSGASFSIDGYDYTYALGNLGLTRTNTQDSTAAITYLSSISSTGTNTLPISSITSEGSWKDVIAPDSDGILTISSAVITSDALIVNSIPPDYQYANISVDSESAGKFTLTTVGASTVTKAWPSDNTFLVGNNTTLTAESVFGGKKFKGESSNAEFTVTVSSGNANFTVIDIDSGASISNNTKISQTAGTITTANKNQTITTSDNYNIVWSGGGDGINVVVDSETGGSISALAENDSFSLKGSSGSYKNYTMATERIISNDSKMFKNTISGGIVQASALADSSNWYNMVSISGGNLSLNSSAVASILSGGGSAFVVEGSSDATVYGTLTKIDNGYSLTKNDESEYGLNSIIIQKTDAPITISNDFLNGPSIIAGGTTFHVTALDSGTTEFMVNYDSTYVEVDAANLTLDLGTIQTSNTNQTINVNGNNIYATSLSTDDNLMFVTYNGKSAVSIGNLNSGETFNIGSSKNYTVTDIGVIINGSVGADSGWDSLNAIFDISSQFDRRLVTLDSNHELDFSSQYYSALIVNNLTSPTVKIGEVFSLDSGYSLAGYEANSISSVNLGTRNNTTLYTDFDTTIKTSLTTSNVFNINGDFYRAAGTSLTIQSGENLNSSSLLYGKVLLNETYSAVNTALNGISVNEGAITVTANGTSGDSIMGLTNGDIFSVDGSDALYSVKGTNSLPLLLNDNKIWGGSDDYKTAGVALNDSSNNDLLYGDNWNYYIAVDENSSVLAIPPSNDFDASVTSWSILNHDMSKSLGTLTSLNGGYSVALTTSWSDDYTLSVKDTTASLPSDFYRKPIYAVNANALFKITDKNIDFTVTDNAQGNGATIGNAENISLTSGTIALPTTTQTVSANVNGSVVAVANGGGDDGIVVIADDTSASIGALSVDDGQDTFYINKVEYEMLQNGSIQRHKDSKFWLGTIKDNGAVDINSLLTEENNWISSVTISSGNLTIDSNILGSASAAYVAEKDYASSIYGTLQKTSEGYNLSSTGSTQSLNSIAISETAKSVSLSAGANKYLNIPIAVGTDATILATAVDSSDSIFSISYDDTWSSDATAISLGSGTWQLSAPTQTLTADGKIVRVGDNTAVSVSNSDGINIAGIGSNEVVTIAGNKYSVNSGEISVSIKDEDTTINGITAGDKFAIIDDTFIKSEAGFVKENSNGDYYLWIDGDIANGVLLESLTTDSSDNWTAVDIAEGGRITVNNDSTTVIFIDSADSLKSIYGALTKNTIGSYTLSDRKESLEANATLDLITIENVTAGLSSAFAKVDIYASGASFVVNSLISDSALFTVDATNNSAAVLGNVSDVSLNSGTLADLTDATTVKANKHTIAAATSSTINVGLNDTLITMSDLTDSEGFTFDGTNYVYKNVGVVKDSTSLYISNDLGGEVTNTIINSGDFLTMSASEDGKTLTLQRGKDDIVFVDKANDSVSAIYARQDFSGKLYTFTQLVEGEYIIDAASLQSNYGISAAFEAQVLTPSTGTYTINDKAYNAVNALTIDTTTDSSKLNSGTVALQKNSIVAMSNDNTIAVGSGNGIQVAATPTTYTLGGLNKSDNFTITNSYGEYTYSMLSDNYLFRTKDDTTELCTVSVTGGALSSVIIADDNYWNSYVILGSNGVLNLSGSSIADGTVIKYDYSAIYADLDVVSANNFTVEKIAGASTADIKTVSLGSDNSTLAIDFATTVRSASGSSTYTINDTSYTALDSALVFVTDSKASSIKSGVITLDDSTILTASGHTVSGSVATIDVEKMRFTPEEGQTFTVDDGTYTLNKVGLTKDDAYVWLKTATSYDMPPDNDDWANMLVLNNTTLNLQSGAPSSINIVVDNDRTARLASLVAGDNEFTLSDINGNGTGISSIVLGDATEILTLAADFVTTVTTGTGSYKINKVNYKGNGLEITTSKNSSALYSGTVTLSADTDFNTVSDNDNTYKATNGDITATATDGSITNLGLLNRNDRFTIGNNYYKVLGSNSNTLIQTNSDDGTATKIYKGLIASGALDTSNIVDANFVDFIQLGASGVLDLTELYGASGWSGIVVGEDDVGDLTARIAQVSYDGTGYTLGTTPYSSSSSLKSVSLDSAVQTFTTSIGTTVNTAATSTYTINGLPFNAQGALKIAAAANSTQATLIDGTVTLEEGVEVTTSQTDNVIKSTKGTITVTADEDNNTVTISGLNAGETFTFGGTSYTMTPIGLLYESDSGDRLNPNVVNDGNSIVTTDLDLSNTNIWLTLLQADGGALELTSNTSSNVVVVDMTNSTQAVKYGTLTKSGNLYTLNQGDNDSTLASITMTGVRATFGAKSSEVPITANTSTTFSVTTTGDFTINATGTNPVITDNSDDNLLTGVVLSTGTIQAPTNIPVTAGSHEITSTNGTMTVSYTDSVASIGGLDSEETFTVDGATYKVMTIGKLFDVTDAANPLEVTAGFANKTFTPDNLESVAVLAVSDNALDIAAQTSDAYIYDSLTNPTTKYATLTVTEGRNKTLTAESDEALVIQSVSIAANDILTLDFATQVESPTGNVTVNNKSYSGTSETLKIASDGTTSTLYEGTIELNGISAYSSATDSNGNTLTRNSGTFTATAASGKFTTLTGLNNAESFTYGGSTYTQNIPGLINTTSNVICPDILAGATITLADLSSADWSNFTAPVNGVLDISGLTTKHIIYDDATTPTTKYATLTIVDGVKTLAGEDGAATSITTVNIAAGDSLSVDFATQIDSAAGTVTVNGNTYAGTTELLIDSDGTTSTLYNGTITLDSTNTSATDSSNNTLTREAGTFTATAVEGAFTTINGLDNTESFTYGGKTYVQSAQGLRNGSVICRALTGTTINLADLDGTWDNILAPTNGVLDISSFSGNAYVYDSATNPTTELATLTTADGVKTLTNSNNAASSITTVNIAAGDNLVVNFATKASAPVGTVTVNNKNYVGTTELVITSDGTTSTLTDGTVTLATTAEVTTTGGAAITCTAGDGITIAVVSGDSETVTFSGLNEGDAFTIGELAYRVSAVAPINSNNELWNGNDYTEGITLAAINTADNWKPMLVVSDGALSVNADTLEDGGEVILVDSVTEPTAVYGDLSKTDGKYTLTKPTTATTNLTTLGAEGVAIEIVSDYAGIDLVANDSAFSDVTLTDGATSYTLDATNTTPSLSNVQSLTLTAGTIAGEVNQVVTTGSNVITPTAINGALTIGTTTISAINEGDAFTLNDKAYIMLNTGLFNDTDNKLVTSGLADGTLTIADIVETQLIAINSGVLDLSGAATGDSLVVDTVESPANIYGKLTKTSNTYTLNKQADGITSITMPDADSTLTTDIAATVTTPSGSKSFTVNNKAYTAKESALTIASDGTTSTLTNGTISLATENATVTTTSGTTITYTAGNDGLTVAVNGGITFSDMTIGDTFTIGENSYKVSAVGLINSSGEFWTGSDYAEGLTLEAINNADNWTTMLAVSNATLNVDGDTLTDGGEVILVDSVTEPTAVYGDLSRAEGKYTLTKPTAATTNLSTISASGVAIEIVSDYAGIDLVANDSAFSDVTLTDGATSYTLDATNTTPSLSNVQSLTLTAGTIAGAVNQVVTTGSNVITPTAINGALTIGTTTISAINEGDAFTLNDKAYIMLNTGLFNDTDNKLVTSGLDDGTLTIADIVETQLIAISSGTLDLSGAATGDSLVVDTVESPANIYAKLTKNGNTYTLTKQADGITSITMPDADSTLTTDIAATVTTPSGSKTFTVNGKAYVAKESALTIASDGTTSTLTTGTISLANANATVTTTSGTTITYTAGNDGLTVAVNDGITLSDLTAGDTFTIGNNAYRVTQLGFHDDNNYLWTGADYTSGVTLDAINNSDNWTRTVTATNDSLTVDDTTLTDGTTAIVIDSSTASTKTLGTLSRSGDAYTLTKGDSEKLSGITVDNTTLAIDNQLADVPVTAKGATFTVTAATPYTVDATGNTPSISDEATAIEISTGTISATTNQTVTATPDSGETNVIGQNNGTFNIGGEAFTVADNSGSVTFSMTNGVPNKVSDLEANANVTIDGRTYTAPQDDSTLTYSDADGWYFDGYVPTKYNITIDDNGNILVDAGVKFTDVISSGMILPEDNTIKLAADVNSIAVNVTNNGTTAIVINDKDGNELVNNLGTVSDVTFDSAGVMVENTSDVAGAVFTIDNGQSFETETATIKANADDCAVGVGSGGTSLSIDKAATVDAPNNTALTLGNAAYTVNGVDFTTSGTAQASITSAGVKLDLATSDAITYNNSGYDGTGTAKADISKAGGVSLTSGASVNSAAGKTFNITGTVTLDANTIDAASATDVTTKASGYEVGNDDVTITGDNDGYKVNIADGKISGLENIGNADGVTIGGLSNGTIKTDKAGAFTVDDRTFVAIGDASVTYGIENSTLATADEVDSVISGDFARGLKVNGGKLQVTGDNVSLDASTDNDRKVGGFNDKATLTTADNIVKIEPTGAGEFTFGDHIFKTDDSTIAFNLNNSSVTGVDSLENGNLIISQDENNFGVNGADIDLAEIDSPVTLSIADSKINSVYGLGSGINGLDNATVYGLSAATVNSKYFEVAGGSVNVVVTDGVAVSLYGLESDMTVNSAPSIAARTTENGTFQFINDIYHINDTLDGIVVFDTDGDTHVINIGEFEGSVSGDLKDLNLNDKPFNSSSDKVTVANDGTDILKLGGLSSGDSIGGSLSKASYVMPEGTLNVNDRGYILQGDDNGVSMTGDGMEVVGLDIDASLTVAKGGAYSVNGQSFNAKDGDTFIAGRDGVYIADPNNKIISEKTKIDDIIENLLGKQEDGTVSLSGDSAASVIASGKLDSPMALTLDNSNGTGTQTADFSNSTHSKRVTLLGGNQDIKFNDEGRNAAYVARTATGKKNIELGDGGDVAVNDSPYAKVSIKAGAGSDTIVNRNGASSTVDVKKNGDTTIVPTSGRVTLQNYDNDNNAKVRTYEYRELGLGNAIKTNEIKFGNGVMTLGDAVVVFDPNASAVGGTFANLVDYYGDEQRVGFTHKAGGVLNASTSADDLILKGNYAETSSDTQKSGSSTLISGSGNDTILAGGGDYINAGAGENQIYITDSSLNDEGATIVLAAKGKNTVHNFNDGYDTGDAILVSDLSALDFTFGDEGLVMRSGKAQITFEGLEPAEDLITYSDGVTAAPYEIKLTDGRATYNAAVAQEDKDIGIGDNSDANIFYGNKKGSGLNFSEYSGAVEVNLNSGAGSVNGTAAQFYNINKVAAGSGDSSLIGKAGAKNTLIAGTGNTSIWSNAGRDLMVGNSSEDKNGSTMFYYLAGDGHDTITNFNFATLATDNSDIINITTANAVTNVYLRGDNVVMQINNSDSDYLTLVDAKGKDFKINNLIAKVDVNADFDNVANCYVADSNNATMSVGADLGNAQVWLDDRITGQHGVYYLGEIKYLDARTANGNSTLVGNDMDNIIYGGEGSNSIWGGFGANNDTLIGGTGHNVFFFGMQNGNDIIQGAKAGDVIDLTTITLEQVASTTVNGGGAKIGLVDGSSLEIQGTADVEYRFSDGSRYKADHNSGQWSKTN